MVCECMWNVNQLDRKSCFEAFMSRTLELRALMASITCTPTVYLTAKVPEIINSSVIAVSIKGQRSPATADSSRLLMKRVTGCLSGDGHNGDLNVTGICERRHIWGCCPSARETICGHWVCNIFKLAFISHCPSRSVLDLTWEPLAFAWNVRHLPSWIVADFTGTVLLLPSGGRGSASHLLTVTVPATSIMGCLSVAVNSLRDIVASTVKNNWLSLVLEQEVLPGICNVLPRVSHH